MKKALVLFAATVAATAAMAQTNQVLSRNAVGYEQIIVPQGGLQMARLDFNMLDGSPATVAGILSNQLPDGSRIFLWNQSLQSYNILAKNRGTWQQGTTVISRAQSFFLNGPTNVASTNYVIYFMGEVPDTVTAPTTTVLGIGGGLNFVSYGYPVARPWSNMTVAGVLSNGSRLALWDAGTQGYSIFTKNRGTWPVGALTNIIQPGQGLWIQSTQSVDWVEAKPYTWP